MTSDARHRALTFLLGEHQLTAAEADEALAVAAAVLNTGLSRLISQAEAENPAPCAEAGHSLKGNLLNLGLPELAHTAQHASEMARQGNLTAAKAAGQTLALALAPLLPGSKPAS
jgi:HPt (histidine-containing phosphotransfer) domain-containing protein